MKKGLISILFVLLTFGCGSEEIEDVQIVTSDYELSEDIIGKWDIQNTAKKVVTCRVFSVTFSSEEFIINYTGGQIRGTYRVDSETEISLNSIGSITNISISNSNISFNISIDGCDISANGVKDNDYNDGDCTTILECIEGIYFSEDGEIDDYVVTFFNDPSGLFYEEYSSGTIDSTLGEGCYYRETPFNSLSEFGYRVEVIENNKDYLIVKTTDEELEIIQFAKVIYFDDGSLSVSFSDSFDGVYENNDNYVTISQAKVFELQRILESNQECSNSNNEEQSCNSQEIIDFFDSLKEVNIGESYQFSFGNYYKTGEGNATPLEGTFEGISYNHIHFNEVNEINGLGNEISFYFREDTGDILFIISSNSYLDNNGDRRYLSIRRFYAPDYPSDGDLNYEHSSYCELWDAALNFTNDLPREVYTYVPDDNFEQGLIELGYDDILDDYVLTENIDQITRLSLGNLNISNTTGIEGFISLTELYLVNNSISSIDLSNNLSLEILFLQGNFISSIDLTNNTSLMELHIGYNNLTQLDLSTNNNLNYLNAGSNLLTEIDLTNNSELAELRLGNDIAYGGNNGSNKNTINNIDLSYQTELRYMDLNLIDLKSINLSNQTKLIGISIGINPDLTSIDLSNNRSLQWFSSFNARFTDLDFSNQPNLGYLSLRAVSPIETINISNNNSLVALDTEYSSIECIQVSQYQIDNQISNASIDGVTSGFVVNYNETSGQRWNEITWDISSTATYSLDCN